MWNTSYHCRKPLLPKDYLARAWCTCPSHQEARKPTSRLWQLKYLDYLKTPKIGVPMNPFWRAYFSDGFLEWIILLPWQVSLQRRTLREDLHSCPGEDKSMGSLWIKQAVCSVWLMLFDSGSDISINDKFDKCHNLRRIPLWHEDAVYILYSNHVRDDMCIWPAKVLVGTVMSHRSCRYL